MTEHGLFYLIWQGNSGLGRLFTLLLLGLGVAAGWTAWSHVTRYRVRETGALRAVRAALVRAREKDQADEEGPKEEDAEEETAETVRRAPELVPLELLQQSAPREESLIGDRLAELARMKLARVRVNVDALQQMTIMRENARPGLAFPGYAVDLCTMGGMLGTFIGLCMMLLQMQGVMPGNGVPAAGGFMEASASLGSIIASKKTAFVTTLVGLACAITVSFLNFLLARAQSAFYDQLERFTVAELLPATVPAVEDETAMEKLSLQLAESFEKLGDVARAQERNAELHMGMQEAFGTTVESLRTLALQAAARGPDEESAGAVVALAPQMAEVSAALTRSALALEEAARRRAHDPTRGSQRRAGWGALVSELGGLAADAVGEVRRNPVVALGGVCGMVFLAVLIF
ncbi:MotA/TolQ/ExbB proton channel family protein [Longimicrobium terrae]|uniref:Biopolymer transport protein ExbB/TolQ n=1 Tax=Longimicrobium terrae TaxID=1639882 RepID=A0A841H2W5_9BACT|nr:MotA/TolQ/ExbB proton channel family protein [Longimicrobium terrae]MBB4638133.1 biopolymer transport protein ExbB/TolQ [Longimicrobium terrae]MBB6072505.1 biopolymer transport protein ExbB/TolQ [Longimicrobium terrae]NNC32085.1 hypothetical protein [Longimicrobium terrae]